MQFSAYNMAPKSTTYLVSFSYEDSDKQLSRPIRSVWRQQFESLVLGDIRAAKFGAQRHHVPTSNYSITYCINESPSVLHRVGRHPYGGPIDDLYETPTLYEVLENVKVWMTVREPVVAAAEVEKVFVDNLR